MKVAREPVVRAGLKLLGEVGLDGLTLRNIAAELGVRAPTLYWRFKNKQDLIDEMATQVLADWAASLPAPVGGAVPAMSWQDGTLRFGRGLRRALLHYRDGARMVAGSYLTDTALYGPMERLLQAYAVVGIAPDDATVCLGTVYSYVIGFVIEEQAVITPSGERNPQYALSARAQRIDAERYPLTRNLGPVLFDNYEVRFERGLSMILAGFAAECLAAAAQSNASLAG